MEILESRSEAETRAIGRRMGTAAAAGQIYCLCGDLGVGKTAFTKGFAEGMEISDEIVSPTFTIVHEYRGRFPFYHFDVYRLGSEEELWDIGWEEYTSGDGVCLIEWADQLREAMPADAIWIHLEKDLRQGTEYRRIGIDRG
jgi:tRNA threonylcarbamoyladenosine biosynthesis protein TsaE